MTDQGFNPPMPKSILKKRDDIGGRTENYPLNSMDTSGRYENQNSQSYGIPEPRRVSSWDSLEKKGSRKMPLTGSEFLRQKIGELVSAKAEYIFRPLSDEEMPVSNIKSIGSAEVDHYGIVPSLDHYLRADVSELRNYFFENARRGDILVASVSSKSTGGIHVKLLCTDGSKHIVLEDLHIKAFCPSSNMISISDPMDPSRSYATGDYIRCEITEIEDEKIILGMKGVTMSPDLQHSVQLGLIPKYDLPRQYALAKADGESRTRKTYEEMLKSSAGFNNPHNVSYLATSMNIMKNENSLFATLRGNFPSSESAVTLRKAQNAKWAHGSVAEGIKHFKAQRFTEAFQCLNKALSIDCENVEALVARGALYGNKGNYEKAIEDFDLALKHNPTHFNARKFMSETLVAHGKKQEEIGKVDDAVAAYSKSLMISPNYDEAKQALLELHAKTEKIDVLKMSGPAAAKVAELQEKLKSILQNELYLTAEKTAKSKAKKSRKDRKRKRRDDSSSSDDDSSTSSSSSTSDSSSSSSSQASSKAKRKKSKKRKSKKSKRKNKSRTEKEKEESLSPFSKRLCETFPGPSGDIATASGLSGYGHRDPISADLEKQLGILKSQKERNSRKAKDSKDSKRKRRSKKRNRRRHGRDSSYSSSSSSDSSHSKDKDKRAKNKISESDEKMLNSIIPDLGDLEEKLSAYYSKVEQGRIKNPPETELKSKHDAVVDSKPRSKPEEHVRKVERKERSDHSWPKSDGKIELRTDEYGNYFSAPTKADIAPSENLRPSAVPMPLVHSPSPVKQEAGKLSESDNEKNKPSVPVIIPKWRTIGSNEESAYTVTKADGSIVRSGEEKEKNLEKKNGSFVINGKGSSDEHMKRWRDKERSKSRSRSRSRSRSKSKSKSPVRRRKGRRSYSPSKSRSRSPYNRRRSYRPPPARYFRGYNRVRRPAGRGFRGAGKSRFRNRFSRSHSRSRSKSFSRSRSKSRPRQSDSKSPLRRRTRSPRRRSTTRSPKRRSATKSPKKSVSGKSTKREISPKKPASPSKEMQKPLDHASDATIQIGSLTANTAADVERLLDMRKEQKKEEIRRTNPDFFRT